MSAQRFRDLYGAGPLHLVGVALSLIVGAYALLRFLGSGPLLDLVIWLVAAIALHDLVLFPLYSALDGLAVRALGSAGGGPRLINHLRVPSVIAALLFLVYFPLILGLDAGLFKRTTSAGTGGYLGRWLLVTAALFAVSALIYLLRLMRRRNA